MIHILNEQATEPQIQEMLEVYEVMIKLAVDIRCKILAGGGVMHADFKYILVENSCEQDDIWGANWYPGDERIEFEALINIRPRQGNRGMLIQSQEIRLVVEETARKILEKM